MSAQINSLNAVSFVAGFAACGLLAAAVMASPQRGTTAQMAAVAPVAQVAKYQPVTGEGVAQVRRARNETMGQSAAPAELMESCPRCR